MFDYSGPMLWTAHLFHDTDVPADRIVTVVDQVIDPIRKNGLDERSIARAQLKMRSSLYSYLEEFAGAGRANLLASFALFDDDPTIVNRLEDGFAQVTSARLQQTAAEYLRPGNRTLYVIESGKSASSASQGVR
jgi:predicted Zn-dependent peptidase